MLPAQSESTAYTNIYLIYFKGEPNELCENSNLQRASAHFAADNFSSFAQQLDETRDGERRLERGGLHCPARRLTVAEQKGK